MGIDRHLGRNSPTFAISGNPDEFNRIIDQEGVLSRVMRARKCPCSGRTGTPNLYCRICKGDGFVYDFQRKLFQADEDSDVKNDSTLVEPFRVPLIEPIKVERLLPPEQGGIVQYNIDSYDAFGIRISSPSASVSLPKYYEKMRVSYYFDRYDFVKGDVVDVDTITNTLTTTKTLFDGDHRFGNSKNVHGDITIINSIYNKTTGHKYLNYFFRKNKIFVTLGSGDPPLVAGEVLVDYFFAPVTKTLPTDINTEEQREKWDSTLTQGQIRIGIYSWFELGQGDMITFLTTELFRDEIIQHSENSVDKLTEFDISKVSEEIFDEDGNRYYLGVDYRLVPFRDIVWFGNQPQIGKKISVRYAYHPTFVVFQDNVVPNNLENKPYPNLIPAKMYSKTHVKDVETIENPKSQFSNFDFDIIN